MTAVHYYLSAAPYYIHVKIFQKKRRKRTVGRVGISGQVGILRARGHAKSLVNGRLNRRNGKKKKTHERGCWTMGAQGRICGIRIFFIRCTAVRKIPYSYIFYTMYSCA